ncbi:N-acetylglucosamine-6-phosphate deacetylase [Arthrobacter sp. Hiyo8]|nr:N-acetylglucosamine-6-phosphate deacetylase [Arthrobacter sp. Hiyo8]
MLQAGTKPTSSSFHVSKDGYTSCDTPQNDRGQRPPPGINIEIAYDTTILSVREIGPFQGVPVIAPGFIDGQVNGYGGLDVNSADVSPQTIINLSAELAKLGVTTWVPTIVTASEEAITVALEQIKRACDIDPTTRAAIPCVHIEGPFISDQDGPRGVHDAAFVRPLDADEIRRWLRASGMVGIVTVSPHTPDAPAQIARIRELGVEVAIGHTHASPEQITAAITAGAGLATHLGNGIATTLPRHPNALWTQLADDRLTAGLIADGHHLPSDTLKVMIRAKTPSALIWCLTAPHWPVARLAATALPWAASWISLLAGGSPTWVRTCSRGRRYPPGRIPQRDPQRRPGATGGPQNGDVHSRPGDSGHPAGLGHLRVGSPADFVLITGEGPGAGTITEVIQSGRKVSGGPE